MLARYLVGGRLDPPYHPTKTSPYFVGRSLTIPAKATANRVIKDTFYLSQDLEFFALSVRTDSENLMDYWNLWVDGKQVAKNIHCKTWAEGLYFQVAHLVSSGKKFYFEYNTADGHAKNVEIVFHFLIDPDVAPVVTGTTDLGNYPDPPPVPPDEENKPVDPPSGGIQLPVTWQPFTSVAEAEKWSEDLGVTANFAKKLDAANYVTEALALLLNTCGGFAEMIQKNPLTINIKSGNGANGYFNPTSGEVVVSRTYNFADAEVIAQAEYYSGQKSSPHKLRTVIHEIGHWLHYHHIGAAMFYRYSSLDPDAYGNQTILSNADSAYISNNLCNYATKWFPIELVPEVFTAKITGVPIDPKIWAWYEMYGGYKCGAW